ncbi:MAG TPA: FTR1 family protein [Gemmatimonadaceae bacterium]|jgi:high-affinity iron transporter
MSEAAMSPVARKREAAPASNDSIGSSRTLRTLAVIGAILIVGLLVWTAMTSFGTPDPVASRRSPMKATLDIAVLVFREGLESVLVLSAITAGMSKRQSQYRAPIGWGAVAGILASIATWFIAVRAIDALTDSIPALDIQAATGLLAIVVLLVVMNWFFHRVYWTGWISMHNRRKRELLDDSEESSPKTVHRVLLGLGLLGFTSLYREGFEVVLFLQSYRLQLGGRVVLGGVLIGASLAAVVAAITFIARRRLPYKTMLIVTGGLLAAVLLVMVGEQVQEMQLAHWISTTTIPSLETRIPGWVGLWFSIFPNVENMVAQAAALILVLGSYALARWQVTRSQA